jgi:hypothetical protein
VSTIYRGLFVSNSPTVNTTVTVAAPFIAQQSQSRSQSNSASTSVTKIGINSSTVVGANICCGSKHLLNQSSSSNGTEGEEDSIIYRQCYDCNVNVTYQVSPNGSRHGPCQLCGVNQRHISCMEVDPDRTPMVFQYGSVCGVGHTCRLPCIPTSLFVVSVDTAECRSRLIHVGN